MQIDAVEAESLAREGSGNAPVAEGPVTRARERWREARNDMPKVVAWSLLNPSLAIHILLCKLPAHTGAE